MNITCFNWKTNEMRENFAYNNLSYWRRHKKRKKKRETQSNFRFNWFSTSKFTWLFIMFSSDKNHNDNDCEYEDSDFSYIWFVFTVQWNNIEYAQKCRFLFTLFVLYIHIYMLDGKHLRPTSPIHQFIHITFEYTA